MVYSKKSILSVFFILSMFLVAFGQNSESTLNHKQNVEQVYFQSSSLFKCLIKLPADFNPQNRYPMVIGLHGGNETPEQFIKIWDGMKQQKFIYAVPQAPYAWFVNKDFGYDWSLWPSGNEEIIERAAVLTENYLVDLIKDVSSKYRVSDIYLLGFSQGAIFAYRAGIKNHKIVKGLICLSGPGLLEKLWSPFTDTLRTNWLPEKYLKRGNNLRVFIANGEKDQFTPATLGLKSKKILVKYGYDVTFRSFDGGHSIDKNILKLVFDWLEK